MCYTVAPQFCTNFGSSGSFTALVCIHVLRTILNGLDLKRRNESPVKIWRSVFA
jgi:hypothetical protein